MMSLDRSALLCDLAETYNVYDLGSLPLETVATLAAGLREESRIKMKMRGDRYPLNTVYLAAIIDGLSGLMWRFGLYGQKPKSIVDMLLESAPKKKDVRGHRSPEEFMAARAKYIRSSNGD